MKTTLRLGFVAALLFAAPFSAHAAELAITTATCGSQSYPANEFHEINQDLTGKLCTSASVTPGGTQDVNIKQSNGATIAVGHGTAATALRVELPTDGTGVVGIAAGSAVIGHVIADTGSTTAVTQATGTNLHNVTDSGSVVQPIPGTTGGLTIFYLTAANSTNATNVKASAGTLYDVELSNNSATPAYVSFYNTAGTPTCGASIVAQAMIPANSTSGGGWVSNSAMGKAFGTGIGICVTTGIAGTGSVAASAYTITLGYK